MKRSIRFLPEVAEDADLGLAWYEDLVEGLGEEFLIEFFTALDRIAENPFLYLKVGGEIRRCLLRRFPYIIYFVAHEYEVIVIGLFHSSRDPRGVGEELRRRGEPGED